MCSEIVIGLVLPMHREMGHRQLRGVLGFAEEQSQIRLSDFCYGKTDRTLPRMPQWTGKVDGVVMSVGYLPGMVEFIRRGGAPAVNIAGDLMDSPLVSVFADAASMVRTGVEHLHGLGYRNLAYVGFQKSHISHHSRVDFHEEAKRRGCKSLVVLLRTFDCLQTDPPYDVKWFDAALIKMVRKSPKPLGIFASHDACAIAVCRLVQELGFLIPEDVAVLGVGDTDLARISSPPVSTIRIPQESMGREAARLLHRIIEGHRLARKNVPVFGSMLVVRESTVGNHRKTRSDIRETLELIHRRACEGATIHDIATELHMSVRTLEIQFNDAVGHSVGEALRRVRLARAEELLLNTDLSLDRVATLTGYSDSMCLIRMFRRSHKITPSEYRKRRARAE